MKKKDLLYNLLLTLTVVIGSRIFRLYRNDFDTFSFIEEYCELNTDITKSELNKIISNLYVIKICQIGVIILVPQLDINEVTEIFVRINSQGKR